MEYIKLNNGVEMPQLGLGTYLIPKEHLSRTIAKAYEMGYRQFDTAWRYQNEADIAKALKENGIKREDVFITTKINADALYFGGYKVGKKGLLNIKNFKSIKSVMNESFRDLNTDYIDLYLVHWPWPIPLAQKMYIEMTEMYRQGKFRAIGVCSSLPPHLDAFKEVSEVVPAVNQFEISPLNTQKKLIKYCQDRGIVCEAMSTFSHFRSVEPRKEIIDNETIRPIAEKYNKSIPQVVLRWMKQQNIVMIPKTWNEEKLLENISIFDFELTPEEMTIIDSLDQGKFLNYHPDDTLTKPWYTCRGQVPVKYQGWKGFEE